MLACICGGTLELLLFIVPASLAALVLPFLDKPRGKK